MFGVLESNCVVVRDDVTKSGERIDRIKNGDLDKSLDSHS